MHTHTHTQVHYFPNRPVLIMDTIHVLGGVGTGLYLYIYIYIYIHTTRTRTHTPHTRTLTHHTHTHHTHQTHAHTHTHTHTHTVELHLSGLSVNPSHPYMHKIRIIGFFFENRLHWQFETPAVTIYNMNLRLNLSNTPNLTF